MKEPLIKDGWKRALLFFGFYMLLFLLFAATGKIMRSQGWVQEETGKTATMSSSTLWFSIIISTMASFLSVWLFRKYVDKQSFLSLGFSVKNAFPNIATGILAALAMLGAGTLVLLWGGFLSFTGWHFQAGYFLSNLLFMLLVAFSEELVFRGYLLHNLMQSMNQWKALIIVSLLFAVIHLGNDGSGLLPVVEIFVAGIMLGINYIFTRNLWFGMALHFAWNFYQGPVLGYKVSGIALPSIMQQEIAGPAWLTGGPFGLEGSVIALLLNGLLILLLFRIYTRQYPE